MLYLRTSPAHTTYLPGEVQTDTVGMALYTARFYPQKCLESDVNMQRDRVYTVSLRYGILYIILLLTIHSLSTSTVSAHSPIVIPFSPWTHHSHLILFTPDPRTHTSSIPQPYILNSVAVLGPGEPLRGVKFMMNLITRFYFHTSN